jgi:hypothetical protein
LFVSFAWYLFFGVGVIFLGKEAVMMGRLVIPVEHCLGIGTNATINVSRLSYISFFFTSLYFTKSTILINIGIIVLS